MTVPSHALTTSVPHAGELQFFQEKGFGLIYITFQRHEKNVTK